MTKKLSTLALLVFAALFAGACAEKGPAERAGEKVDDAMSDAADAMEDAGDAVEEAAEDAADKVKGE